MGYVVMPKISPRVSEAVIVEWLKKEGEEVKKDEPLLVVETEKVTVEINSPTSGIIKKILASEGINVKVSERLAEIA